MKTYFPKHSQNRMQLEGDLKKARKRFFNERPNNLLFLLEQRYMWMNEYIYDQQSIFELGCGAGLSKAFIVNENLRLTDVSNENWVDLYVNAMELPFPDNSVDILICSHMIHHLANPLRFFEGACRVLRPGGLILISEINTSLLMRFLLRAMRHEGWSYEVNIFDKNEIANDPSDPWSANCAIPEMLFKDSQSFEKALPQFRVIRNELTECLIFPLSGGVIARSPSITLSFSSLRLIARIDNFLIMIFPKLFALGRRVVLQKA